MATLNDVPRFTARRPLLVGGVLGVLGLAGALIAIGLDPRRALLGYLFAYCTVASVAIGALVLLLIGHASNARWLSAVRRFQHAITIVFPALVVLFLPIAVGVDRIYVWADPHAVLSEHARRVIDTKRAWLNDSGFVLRSFLYLAVFVIASEVLRRWSLRRDGTVPTGDPEDASARERVFASAMLPPVGLALTFASIDWLMSLQPEWFSSMFPVYFFAAGFVAAIGVVAILAWRSQGPAELTGHHFHALGRMLFGFVVFWAYTSYFQGFLIQIANRPNEVTFFIARTHSGWGSLLIAILLARFALPFFLLLPRRPKFAARYVAAIAAIILVGHILDVYWLAIPSAGEALSPALADVASLVGITGICVAFSAWRQRGVPIVPTGDPFLAAGRRYESPT